MFPAANKANKKLILLAVVLMLFYWLSAAALMVSKAQDLQPITACVPMEGIGCMYDGTLTPPSNSHQPLNAVLDCQFEQNGNRATVIIPVKVVGYWRSTFHALWSNSTGLFTLGDVVWVGAHCSRAS